MQCIPEKGSPHEVFGWALLKGTHPELERVVNPSRRVTGCLCSESTPLKEVGDCRALFTAAHPPAGSVIDSPFTKSTGWGCRLPSSHMGLYATPSRKSKCPLAMRSAQFRMQHACTNPRRAHGMGTRSVGVRSQTLQQSNLESGRNKYTMLRCHLPFPLSHAGHLCIWSLTPSTPVFADR